MYHFWDVKQICKKESSCIPENYAQLSSQRDPSGDGLGEVYTGKCRGFRRATFSENRRLKSKTRRSCSHDRRVVSLLTMSTSLPPMHLSPQTQAISLNLLTYDQNNESMMHEEHSQRLSCHQGCLDIRLQSNNQSSPKKKQVIKFSLEKSDTQKHLKISTWYYHYVS